MLAFLILLAAIAGTIYLLASIIVRWAEVRDGDRPSFFGRVK